MIEGMELLKKYFDLSTTQENQFVQLFNVYKNWNDQINVISRKDFDSIYLKHVLHSLGIAKIISFSANTKILDIGTGGGFPGIPLAILFPKVQFHLVDSIGKKIKVVKDVTQELKLQNVSSEHTRAETIKNTYDFIVSRAVTQMPIFLNWTNGKFKKEQKNTLKNGILYLKGGDLTEELKGVLGCKQIPLNTFFEEPFFKTKKLVYIKK